MIDKKELRIGNSVMYDNRIFQISAITDEFPLLNTPEFGIGVVDWNNLDPIPITEEALVKMGFEKQENNWKRLTICEDSSYLYWEKLAGIKLSVDNESIFIPYVNSIHRLQNIIYCLTQTELSYDQHPTNSNANQ